MVSGNKEEKRQEALKLLRSLPENFFWNNVNGPTMKRDEIIEEVKVGSGIGESFVDLIGGLAPTGLPSVLGKRYVCLVCWTEIINTKAGDGKVSVVCCGQRMWLKQPKWIPSAD